MSTKKNYTNEKNASRHYLLEIGSTSPWKQRKLAYLDYAYSKYMELFDGKDYRDDRQLFVNVYNQIYEAIDSLADDPCSWIKCAINHEAEKDMELLNTIARKWDEGLWNRTDRT